MAEPAYPSLDNQEDEPKIGFEGLTDDVKRERIDDKGVKQSSEEIGLIEIDKERDDEEQDTVCFKDGTSKIDYILTYKDKVVGKDKSDEAVEKSSARRRQKRETFFDNLKKKGMKFEVQEPKYYDGETYFVKVHASFRTLQKGAEELLIRMPIKEVDLPRKDKPWYRDVFSQMSCRDPFELFDPKVPKQFQYKDYFTAPYIRKHREDYIGSDNELTFFSSAQRSAITKFILENTNYGENEDQVGVSRLVSNGTFTSGFILHDGSYRVKKDELIENERQVLYHEWSHPKNWYKYQPLENIRHYFGEKVGLYFVWVGFYTYWLTFASIVGVIVLICGLFTLALRFNAPAREICEEGNREFFYMCPLCDETCDFWYYQSTCTFSRISLLFDYGGTVFFAAFMALWSVLFLEFWKRTEAQLQYEWDTLGYEAGEQRERPEFVQSIKAKIKNYPEEKRKQYKIYNQVLERYEYIQPTKFLYPKITLAFSILLTMVAAVIAIVFCVLLYRLAVSAAIYRAVRSLPGGPSAADLIVSISGSCLQLIFIVVMNQVYERLATWLTGWELHRTSTEYEDSFTLKMYLFQFINFYSSIFYIAFFKGKFTGYPGGYIRIGFLRLDECSSYGCLLELTIQLAIIFVGKQVLNDFSELGIPYAKKLIKTFLRKRKEKKKEAVEDDSFVRWEKDFEMVPLSIHGLFFEYLELVVQYGFVTIFVAAFPLAPLCAWLNNVIEIRLDAHKFVQVFRRPVAERAQDIGAWFYLLRFVTNLCVVTNAFLIAFTSQFIDREVYNHIYEDDVQTQQSCSDPDGCTRGFVTWATSAYNMTVLLEPLPDRNDETVFPIFDIMSLQLYDFNTSEVVTRMSTRGSNIGQEEDVLYQPFFDFDCLKAQWPSSNFTLDNFTESEFSFYAVNPIFQNLTLTSDGTSIDGRISPNQGICFNPATECRFRGQFDSDGERPLEYYRTIACKLAFVILFEHIIFLISVVLDKLVPDVPQSVEDEIRREKLLAARLSSKAKGGSESPEPQEVEVSTEIP